MSTTIAEPLGSERIEVTRVEIAEYVEDAFAAGAAGRGELLAAATGRHARPALLDLLGSLPDRQYAELRQLWTELPEVPIGL